jgi:hypothetical protein
MSTHVVAHNRFGPDTYEVNVAVKGGQLVEPDTGGKIKVAVAGSLKVLGVALYGALPASTSQSSTSSYDETVIDHSVPQPHVAVAFTGTFKLTCDDAVVFGDYVQVGALGAVKKAPVSPAVGDSRLLVGKVVEPNGISAGAKGLIRLSL